MGHAYHSRALIHYLRCLTDFVHSCSCLHTSGMRGAMELGEPAYVLSHGAVWMDALSRLACTSRKLNTGCGSLC